MSGGSASRGEYERIADEQVEAGSGSTPSSSSSAAVAAARVTTGGRFQSIEIADGDGDFEETDGILRPPRRRCCCGLIVFGCPSCRSCGGSNCSRGCKLSTVILAIISVLIAAVITGLVLSKIDENRRFQLIDAELEDMKQQMAQQQKQTDELLAALHNDISDLRKQEDKFERSTQSTESAMRIDISSIYSTLEEHDSELVRLNNGTSNADVLDKMRETRSWVQSVLSEEKELIDREVAAVDEKLAVTEQRVHDSVDASVNNIKNVQQNVTVQLSDMGTRVRNDLVSLSDVVDAAKAKIHSEVLTVQDDIAKYVAVTNEKFAAENDFVKYQLAGTFTLLGCLISLWHMTSHLRHYYKPDVQRRIMAVLWMVPFYSITCWLSLVFPTAERVLSVLRDCFEAYVIYTFIALLIAVLEDGKGLPNMINALAEQVVEDRAALAEYNALIADQQRQRSDRRGWGLFALWSLESNALSKPHEHIKPPYPCCYVSHRPSTVAAAWLYQCQMMAFQFVVLKPLLTLVPLLLYYTSLCDVNSIPMFLDDNSINWAAPNIYILFVENVSVAVAFYGLLCFYHGTEKDLEWCNPWPKFLCIKGVVFATFWQALGIELMSVLQWVDARQASQITNLLICIEMLLASLAHFYIFPHEEWAPGYKKQKEKGIMLKDTLALRDFVKDMRLMVTSWNIEHETPAADGGTTSVTDAAALATDAAVGGIAAELSAVDKFKRTVQQQQWQRHQRMLNDIETGSADATAATSSHLTGAEQSEQLNLLNHPQLSTHYRAIPNGADAAASSNNTIVSVASVSPTSSTDAAAEENVSIYGTARYQSQLADSSYRTTAGGDTSAVEVIDSTPEMLSAGLGFGRVMDESIVKSIKKKLDQLERFEQEAEIESNQKQQSSQSLNTATTSRSGEIERDDEYAGQKMRFFNTFTSVAPTLSSANKPSTAADAVKVATDFEASDADVVHVSPSRFNAATAATAAVATSSDADETTREFDDAAEAATSDLFSSRVLQTLPSDDHNGGYHHEEQQQENHQQPDEEQQQDDEVEQAHQNDEHDEEKEREDEEQEGDTMISVSRATTNESLLGVHITLPSSNAPDTSSSSGNDNTNNGADG